MRVLSLVGLFCLLASSGLIQARNVIGPGTAAPQDEPGLEILKAYSNLDESTDAGRARIFTIVVKNTGERSVKSVGFAFNNLEPAGVREIERTQSNYRCGFVIADLDIMPDSEVTINRELSGAHCIPEPQVQQSVRIQEILYEDGGTWLHLADDHFGWTRVKPRMARVANPSNQ